MTRPPVGSTGTLAELQVEAGDVYRHFDGGMYEARWNDGDLYNFDLLFGCWGASVFESEHKYTLISRANPDQPALQIEAGKYYRTRDGRKVGPMTRGVCIYTDRPSFFAGGSNAIAYRGDGVRRMSTGIDSSDLIAEWRDDQPAHIITHEGREYDLTALETPFGLLPEPVQKALRAWPHGRQRYAARFWTDDNGGMFSAVTYRAKPAPAEPQPVEHVLHWGPDLCIHTHKLTITTLAGKIVDVDWEALK